MIFLELKDQNLKSQDHKMTTFNDFSRNLNVLRTRI